MSDGRSAGIPGLAVAMIGAGSLLVYSGIRNVPMLDVLRSIARGQAPVPPGAATSPTDPTTPTTPPAAGPAVPRTLPPGVKVKPGSPTRSV